jgi:hypothetical protein
MFATDSDSSTLQLNSGADGETSEGSSSAEHTGASVGDEVTPTAPSPSQELTFKSDKPLPMPDCPLEPEPEVKEDVIDPSAMTKKSKKKKKAGSIWD